jgi:hypothetical protein
LPTFDGTGQCQPDASVAGSRLDDGHARAKSAGLLRGLDHAHGDPVFDGAAGVQEFAFSI